MGCGRLGLILSATRHENVCIVLMFLTYDQIPNTYLPRYLGSNSKYQSSRPCFDPSNPVLESFLNHLCLIYI